MRKPLNTIQEKHKNKKLIVFDLDGTLTESKMNLDKEMALLLAKLLEKKKVAVIGGGMYKQFQFQFLDKLHVSKTLLGKLFLFPTTSTAFYKYVKNSWMQIYSENFSQQEKKIILRAFDQTFKELNYVHPKKVYGELIEDRETQISFSALGQMAPMALKKKWRDKNTPTKLKIAKTLQKKLSNFHVGAAGFTTIDITRKGIDKAYGLRQIKKHLGIPFSEMLFVGDALFKGGNDCAALKTGVSCVAVKGPEEAKKLIRFLIS